MSISIIVVSIIVVVVMDDHGSYTTADVVTHCIKHTIQLLILSPHTLYMLLTLDLNVFAPLKCTGALAKETDAASRVNHGRVQRRQ
jgi:hypothetical protein